jgi:FtsP/CotA-like multicopper oxidase with cupredoxin domain
MRAESTHSSLAQLLQSAALVFGATLALTSHAAAPGIKGAAGTPVFNLSAAAMRTTQPNGKSLYSWGYGCTSTSGNTFAPAMTGANCPAAQLPGPTLIVTEGDVVTINLTNNLPAAAGSTSMLFPGFQVAAVTGTGKPGLLTQEAPSLASCVTAGCNTVSYTFTASTPGTHSYFSGTQGDLQVEMGMYGALIVLPRTVPAACNVGLAAANLVAETTSGETDFRLAHSAYDHPSTCYDREYLFQFSEMDDNIHQLAEQQVLADQAKPAASQCKQATGCLVVITEPYTPDYFLVNGRSMPDDMDPNYVGMYPNQPYNGNPHMHPGELTLVRIIGQGRWQHPFHEHANHVRVLARDGNLLLSLPTNSADPTSTVPAGPLMFTTTTTPGMTMDGIFYWTGKGLNWDVFGHDPSLVDSNTRKPFICIPDTNGYFTSDPTAPNYYEWCGDHNKALEKHPTGQVASGGPVTLPDPNIVTNGNWYGGSPYLGGEATVRAVGGTPIPPAGTVANSPTAEAGYAYMWHSHNEREITTDNVFPGGMMMMMLVDPRSFAIDETN